MSRFHYTDEGSTSMGPLFEDYATNHQKPVDICRNRHRGNAESEAAFQSIKDKLTEKQEFVLATIRTSGKKGMTCDELSELMGKGENVYSGRFTELHLKGKIEKIGTRPTRSGNPAAVWKAI